MTPDEDGALNQPDLPALTGEQKRWAFAAAALFLLAVGFLGFALNAQAMVVFAVGWLALMIFASSAR